MDAAKSREWRLLNRAERERRVLVLVFQGTVLRRKRSTIAVGHRGPDGRGVFRGPTAVLSESAVYDTLDRMEVNGYIAGYAPVLSAEGRKYVEGLKGLRDSLSSHEVLAVDAGTVTPGICPDCGKPHSDHTDRVVRCTVTTTIETKKGA